MKDSDFLDEGRILLLFKDTFGVEGQHLLCSLLQRDATSMKSLRRLLFILEMG